MSIDALLNNLNKVKRTGDGKWLACCPSHNDKTASLAITDNGDGRILINCFAGCDTYSVLSAVGLDWGDVMPEKQLGHNLKPVKQVIYASDALKIIQYEARIVMASAFAISNNKPLSLDELERLKKSMNMINKAVEGAGL